MRVIVGLAVSLSSIACTPTARDAPAVGPEEHIVARVRAVGAADWPAQPRHTLDEEELRRMFPLSRYARFPSAIRPLIRRADMGRMACANTFHPEQYRACNLHHRQRVELERRGWCYGGATVVAHYHWLRCRDDETFRAGRTEAFGEPFSALEIAWADDEASRDKGGAGDPRLPALLRQRWRKARQELSRPASAAGRRRFPLSRYSAFPELIRPALQRLDIESDMCGHPPADLAVGEREHACNRVTYATAELERLGWCGSRRCSENKNYRFGEVTARGILRSESFIRWLIVNGRSGDG